MKKFVNQMKDGLEIALPELMGFPIKILRMLLYYGLPCFVATSIPILISLILTGGIDNFFVKLLMSISQIVPLSYSMLLISHDSAVTEYPDTIPSNDLAVLFFLMSFILIWAI